LNFRNSTRQPLPTFDRTKYAAASGLAHGAYILADAPGADPEVILIASGSEVSLAVNAHEILLAEGIRSRVVSMPSWDIFDHQSQDYRDNVLPPAVKRRIAIEQASTFGWERYVSDSGKIIGMKTFGASAPLKETPAEIRLRAGTGGCGGQRAVGPGVRRAEKPLRRRELPRSSNQ
jgi:transketolase